MAPSVQGAPRQEAAQGCRRELVARTVLLGPRLGANALGTQPSPIPVTRATRAPSLRTGSSSLPLPAAQVQ